MLGAAPNALANRSRARMKLLGRLCFTIFAVAMMLYAYQYAMSQAIHTVIASQPPAPKLADPPAFTAYSACDLGLTLSGSRPARPCRFELSPPAASPTPIPMLSKPNSEKSGLWCELPSLAL